MTAGEGASPEEQAAGAVRRGGRGFARRAWRWLAPLLLGALIGATGILAAQWWIELRQADSVFIPAPPENPAVSVTLSHPLMAALIQRGMDEGESPVVLKGIQTDNRSGRLEVRGTAELLGRKVPTSVELEPYIDNGVMRMHVRKARLGPLPVPSNVERLAEAPLNRELAATLANLPANLTSVAVTDSGLTVTANVRLDDLRFSPR